MKKIILLPLIFIFTQTIITNGATDALARLKALKSQLLRLEEANPGSERDQQLEETRREIEIVEQHLYNEHYASPQIIYKSDAATTGDVQLVSFVLYDWSSSSYRVVAHVRNQSMIYAKWVKVYFYFYKNGVLVNDTFSRIEYETYEDEGILPYHESFFDDILDKVAFDEIRTEVRYDEASGDGDLLCDQILQLLEVSVGSGAGYVDWSGIVNNASLYSVERPRIWANITRSDSLIDLDNSSLDTKCQGDRSVIIDHVVDTPPEAQEIVLHNCTEEEIDIGGWYLGNNVSPYSYTIPQNTDIAAGDDISFDNDDLNFTIGTQDEIIYLSNPQKTLIDQWTKDENNQVLQPLTSACFDAYLFLPETFGKIQYKLNYKLDSMTGSANIAPNYPRFTLARYEIAPNTNHEFTVFLLDPNEDPVEFQIDWGNGERTGWLGPVDSRSLGAIDHSFNESGEYWISARARDSHGVTSNWSDSVKAFVDRTVPVELVAFSARIMNDHILLSWVTESETNNLGFHIERSLDKRNWRQVGFVRGHGTTTSLHNYQFRDNTMTGDSLYYRLQQIDQDGSYAYSEIITVNTNMPLFFDMSIHPNPFNTTTRISYWIPEQRKVWIDVFDVRGQHIASLKNDLQRAGEHSMVWNPGSAPSGTYFVRVQTQEHSSMQKCLLLK